MAVKNELILKSFQKIDMSNLLKEDGCLTSISYLSINQRTFTLPGGGVLRNSPEGYFSE